VSLDLIQVTVRQTIPSECLAPIEAWLLRCIFKTEEKVERVRFDATWEFGEFYQSGISSDHELPKALSESRETCPELCAAVEREITKHNEIVMGAVAYEKIFQSILRRYRDYPSLLPYISIVQLDRSTNSSYYDESFTVITADSIETIRTCRVNNGKTVEIERGQNAGRHSPTSPYILFSSDWVRSPAARASS
jgi:hypothetical protein